jgi:hypothetical protein
MMRGSKPLRLRRAQLAGTNLKRETRRLIARGLAFDFPKVLQQRSANVRRLADVKLVVKVVEPVDTGRWRRIGRDRILAKGVTIFFRQPDHRLTSAI